MNTLPQQPQTYPNLPLADLPQPAGAVHVFEWYDTNEPINAVPPTLAAPGVCRYFRGGSWAVVRQSRETAICVQVDGTQYHDGLVEHRVVLDDDDLLLTEARELIAALMAAVDEVERCSR